MAVVKAEDLRGKALELLCRFLGKVYESLIREVERAFVVCDFERLLSAWVVGWCLDLEAYPPSGFEEVLLVR